MQTKDEQQKYCVRHCEKCGLSWIVSKTLLNVEHYICPYCGKKKLAKRSKVSDEAAKRDDRYS